VRVHTDKRALCFGVRRQDLEVNADGRQSPASILIQHGLFVIQRDPLLAVGVSHERPRAREAADDARVHGSKNTKEEPGNGTADELARNVDHGEDPVVVVAGHDLHQCGSDKLHQHRTDLIGN